MTVDAVTYAELRGRAARLAGVLRGRTPARRPLTVIVRCRRESVELSTGHASGSSDPRPASPRVSAADHAYCREDSGAAPLPRGGRGSGGVAGKEHPGALDARDEDESLMLYTSARPAGRRTSRARTVPIGGGVVAGRPSELPVGRPDAGRDAALPHDGHALAARHAPGRRLLRVPARNGTRKPRWS